MLPTDFDSGAVRMETWILKPDLQMDSAKMRIAIQLLSGCNERQDFRGFCCDLIRKHLLSASVIAGGAESGNS